MYTPEHSVPCPESVRQAELAAIVQLYQAGRLEEIETRARAMTERYPADVFGYHVLGTVFLQRDQSERALPYLEHAAALSPQQADIHNNLGIALLDLGHPDKALVQFQTALHLRPDFATAYCNMGSALEAQGRLDEAADSYRQALALRPDYAKAHYNLGNIFKDLGRLAEAADSYQQALAVQPDYVSALVNRGLTLLDLGRLDEAEQDARQAVQDDPERAEAHNLLAAVLLTREDEPTEALDAIIHSLWIAERPETKRLFVTCARRLEQAHMDVTVQRYVIRAMTEPWARPGLLEALATQTVLNDPDIAACASRAVLAWPRRMEAEELYGPLSLEAVCQNAMLRCLLDAAPVCSLELERFCTQARSILLETASRLDHETPSPTVLTFYGALARQCHINEYMFAVQDAEQGKARDLGEVMEAALMAGRPIPPLWPLAVGSYVSLGRLHHAKRLLARTDWPEPVLATLVQQICEPAEEQAIRDKLPRLTPIDDAVSCLVRQQYEENPYPRWVKAAPPETPLPFDTVLRQCHPQATFTPLGNKTPLDILIAGCGTGQHAQETARRYQDARVLAVDLSLASLGYAARKSRELGITNITYAQADILHLGGIGRTFDVIESSGVLHHLAEPLAGWQVLLSLLRPGGFMRIGLYSRLARRDISRARARIATMGYDPAPETIRLCRQELLDQQRAGEDWHALFLSDFYSISGCRDLLFHVQEHCLTLEAIAGFLREQGLEFIGFAIEPRVLEQYWHRYPQDRAANNLDNWIAFERDFPDTFMEMYQFWIQKPA